MAAIVGPRGDQDFPRRTSRGFPFDYSKWKHTKNSKEINDFIQTLDKFKTCSHKTNTMWPNKRIPKDTNEALNPQVPGPPAHKTIPIEIIYELI